MTPTVAEYVQFFSSGPGFVLLVFASVVAFGGYCGVVGWHPFSIRVRVNQAAVDAERARALRAASADYPLAKVVSISGRRKVS